MAGFGGLVHIGSHQFQGAVSICPSATVTRPQKYPFLERYRAFIRNGLI